MALSSVRPGIIAFFVVGGILVDARASVERNVRDDTNDGVQVLRTSSLRSAYLVRAGIVRYDADDMSPRGVQRQLQRHFDVVIALLIASTPERIELALDRLEAALQKSWTAEERAAWRHRLLESRRLQIARLIAYRNRCRFPLNEGQALQPVPVFVDAHGTACAMGHLMRLSGLEREVAGIRSANNLVYVPDVQEGPLLAWTLTGGITLEEAALIQPAYGPVLMPKPDHAIEVLNDAMSFEFENLRYSNFRIIAGDDPAAPAVNIPVSHQACSWLGCGPTIPIIWDVDLSRDRQFLISLPSVEDSQVRAREQSPPLLSSFPRVVVQFDVEVTAPNLRIAGLPSGGSLLSNSYYDGPQFHLFVDSSQDQLWIDQVHNPLPECDGWLCPMALVEIPNSTNNAFQATEKMTVVTELYLPPDQAFRGQFINFTLVAVPEPAAAALAFMAISLSGAWYSRSRVD